MFIFYPYKTLRVSYIHYTNNCTYYFYYYFWLYQVACGILVPRPGIDPRASAVKV